MDSVAKASLPNGDAPPASVLLDELKDASSADRVSVGDILDKLEGRAVGVVLLLLALPMCIPNVPGISTIFGLLIIAPALQLIMGADELWLPNKVRSWTVPREALNNAIRTGLPALRKIEGFVRPRWSIFIRPPAEQWLGLQTLLMALVLLLPIPGGNWPPGMTVAATGLALAQRDGRMALLTLPMAAISLAVAWIGFRIGVAVLHEIGTILTGLFSGSWFF
ncbi:MAG: exopolysaccharide biosynthesis protein [Alphaproteobacteria bacterium]